MQGRARARRDPRTQAGANVNARDKNGTPVLYSAVQGGNSDVVQRPDRRTGADTSVNRKLLLDTAKSRRIPKLVGRSSGAAGRQAKEGGPRDKSRRRASVRFAAPPAEPTAKSASTGTGKKPLTGKQAYDLTQSRDG